MKFTLSSIYDIEKKIDLKNIDISDFLNHYHKILKDDKYTPIFSKTDKYKSFPGNLNKKQRNFIHNNKWKMNKCNTDEIKLLFNKLSIQNYDIIYPKIIEELIKNKNIIEIFFNQILDKIWFDEEISVIYIKLINDISSELNILKCLIKIENKCYIYNKVTFGPFVNIYSLHAHLKNNKLLINKIYDLSKIQFNNRLIFIDKMNKNLDDEYISINKRKIFGTCNFFILLYINNLIDDEKIKFIIDDLLNLSNKRKEINLLEYESICKIWNLVKNAPKKNFIIKNYYSILKNLIPIKNKRITILINNIIQEMENDKPKEKEYNLGDLFKILTKYNINKNINEAYNQLNKFNIDIKSELVIYQLEHNNIIDLLLKYINKKELNSILSKLDLDDLELDIPNIKSNYEILLKKI